ncbi:MAG: Ig-like domain-containing protein [Armatimonadetes bacterium]|nr:Ig-like domain-containing protein [Armatimonadota bacterium]
MLRIVGVALAVLAVALARPAAAQGTMRYLDNGQVRVGVDLALGAAITYLSRSGTTDNVVNSADAGREIQQSYYSGPNDFGNWAGQAWPWNPISVGDQWGNHSQVLAFTSDGTTMYSKIIPMQWGGSNPAGTPGDCTFENWVTLEGKVVHVRNRLNNARADRTFYGAYFQELPAVYTNGPLHHLWTYKGTNPFAGEPATEMPNAFMWSSWRSTEGWAAQVNDAGWGLGVYAPGCGQTSGGFFPQVDANTVLAGPKDGPTSYMAPNHAEILDWNIAYEFSYDLILDTLPNIRSYVYANPFDPRPSYAFRSDRAHWTYNNATDTGWPIDGCLDIDVGWLDPMLIGPFCGFRAADVPKLYIRMAASLSNPPPGRLTGQIFFELENGAKPFSEAQSVRLNVINDGQYHTYELDMAAGAAYTGFVSCLRFDPVVEGASGDRVRVAWISHEPLAKAGVGIGVPARTGIITTQVALKAFLWRLSDRAYLPGKAIAFRIDGSLVGSSVTDASGAALWNYTVPAGAATRTIGASFAGDEWYDAAFGSAVLTAQTVDTKLYVPDRGGALRTSIYLKGYLYKMDSSGIGGKTLTFKVNGTVVGTGVTLDPSLGAPRAQVGWTAPGGWAAGSYPIRIEWPGDAGFRASSGNATATLTAAPTYIWLYGRTTKRGQPMALKAFVRSLPDYAWQPGLTITFNLDGSGLGSAVTDASGVASFSAAATGGLTVGSHTARASYAGGSSLAAGSGQTTVGIVP